MTSTRITPTRLGLAAGIALLATLSVTTPASAIEFPPDATVEATSGCEGDVFHLHTTMSNPDGFDAAHFVVTADDVKGPITIGVGVDIVAGDSRVDDWQFFEGVTGSVHITSDDNNPVVDYYFEVTPDCVPEVTTTIAEIIPETTVPVTTIVAAIPEPTNAVEVLVPTALPATGSSSPLTSLSAFGALGVGILLVRLARRAI